MVYKLFTTCRYSGAIAIVLLLTNAADCWATEYVFTAPPEVDREVIEIPASDTEYPLYECENESEADPETALDSHDCTCTDCELRQEDERQPSTDTDTKTKTETETNTEQP